MGRPKTYDRAAKLAAARDLFWERGYEATSVSDLEQATGLDRSSLYREFGSKRQLFGLALDEYLQTQIGAMLAGVRAPGAGLDAVLGFFSGLAGLFRSDPAGSTRGCLMVNSTAELAAADAGTAAAAAGYRDLLRESFASALSAAAASGELEAIAPQILRDRALLLASATTGIFLAARIDPADAAQLCDATASVAASWRAARPRRNTARGTRR
jgi:AcrR family transcriptional regulator